jgi:spermidine/putrescine transport system permease protein
MTASRHQGWLVAFSAAVLVFLLAPVLIVVIFSFNNSPAATLPIRGLSFEWYRTFFADSQLTGAVVNSIVVAVFAAAISTVIGTLAAIGIVRYGGRLATLTTGLIVLPLLVPPLLIGVGLLSFFSHFNIRLSLDTVVMGHVVVTLPLVALTVGTRLAGIDVSLEEAASVLGANRWQVFRHVTFPLLRVAVLTSALLVAAVSLDEFLVTFFTIGTQQTLPLIIWGDMRNGVTPEINAVSALLLATTCTLVIAARQLGAGRGISLRRRDRARSAVGLATDADEFGEESAPVT